ncbi:MAG: ribose ABC transporter permease [Ardenticatenia bacterium]|nr:MAG: ribose ABC transporter permease [Ardenticatenia bacterium]
MHLAREARSPVPRSWLRVFDVQRWGIVLVLIVLVAILGVVSPVFLSAGNLRNILQQVSTIGILATGATVLMIAGGIDLSIGSIISVAAVVMGTLIKAGTPAELAILVGLLIGCGIGFINGLLAAYTRAHPFILTLGTMTMFQGVAIIITEGFPITDLGRRFEWIGSARIWEVPVSVIILLLVMMVCYFLLRYTRVGRIAYAIGGNEYTTFLAGIPVRRYKILFYVIGGFFAGLASVVLASRISSAIPTMGADYTLQAIGAVVIGGVPLTGGRGSVWGTFTGVLLLGIIANGLNLLHVEASWQYVLTGFVILVAVILHEQRMGR